jgi:NADH-quinone oxidoreductase subunit L
VMAIIGAGTALFAAVIAVGQNDIKRVLAYSTISQLGYMIAALGIGAYVAAAFHLVMHAFFKALLFLGSGSVIHGMEHGVLHTGDHAVDPQNMFNMGGLRNKMPVTFLTFTIGGLALSGFPLVTAGFWSKDEILADAFGNGYWLSFIVLALAALLTAFYTARQITLTFLGEPRTKEAAHAQETKWTMTLPLVVLAVFAVAAGWVGIPEGLTGGAIPNWFHEFVAGTLAEHLPVLEFNFLPMLLSMIIALTGLTLGWWVYHGVKAGQPDPLAKPLGIFYTWMKNKFYFDELYDRLFVRPAYWLADTFTNKWMDRGVIDGTLHTISRAAYALGGVFRNYFDLPVVNGFGDMMGEGTKSFGHKFRAVQTGKIQQYMLSVLVFAVGILFYYLLSLLKP